MKKIIFLYLIFLFISCNDNVRSNNFSKQIINVESVNIRGWLKEIIKLDSIMINGKLRIINTKSEIIALFGKPISTEKIDSSEFLFYLFSNNKKKSFTKISYNDISFDGYGDNYIFNRIDFNNDNYLELSSGLILKKDLNVRKICEIYPESCKLTIGGGNTWSGHIELRVKNNGLYSDLRWFLIFRNDMLKSVELHRF